MRTEQSVDVAIVGSGIAGIATAYYLVQARKNLSVLLIDGRQPMSYTSAQSGDNYRNWWPHPTMTEFANDSIDELDRLARDTDNVFNMTRGGYVLATLRAIAEEKLLENVVARGKTLRAKLRKALAGHEYVGDIRGRGLFIGVELVADRDTKEPFDAGLRIHKRIQTVAMENGLLCYGMGGTIDGRRGDHILLAPPYNIGDVEEHELVDKFVGAVRQALPA